MSAASWFTADWAITTLTSQSHFLAEVFFGGRQRSDGSCLEWESGGIYPSPCRLVSGSQWGYPEASEFRQICSQTKGNAVSRTPPVMGTQEHPDFCLLKGVPRGTYSEDGLLWPLFHSLQSYSDPDSWSEDIWFSLVARPDTEALLSQVCSPKGQQPWVTESVSGLRLHRPRHLLVWQLRLLSSAPEAQFPHLCLKLSVPALQTCYEALRALNERGLEEGPVQKVLRVPASSSF